MGAYDISVARRLEIPPLKLLAEAAVTDTVPVVSAAVRFDTAWSPPFPVVDAIAEQFPELKIKHEWACEGGCTQGVRVIDGELDEVTKLDCDSDDPRWIDICKRLKGYRPHRCRECDKHHDECEC